MSGKNEVLEVLKTLNDEREINDLIISLAENPNEKYLVIVDYILENYEQVLFEKVKINVIYLLGEIANKTRLSEKYHQVLISNYYNSDRWVRSEIIRALVKVAKNVKQQDELIRIMNQALSDDYNPIIYSALLWLMESDDLPLEIFNRLISILNSDDNEIRELIEQIINKHINNTEELFKILNHSENYKLLNKFSFRTLIAMQFRSIIQLEEFRLKIEKSNWNLKIKTEFVREIEIFQKIILK